MKEEHLKTTAYEKGYFIYYDALYVRSDVRS